MIPYTNMKTLNYLVLTLGLIVSCKVGIDNIEFQNLYSDIKKSDFINEYKGTSNMYKRNNIFTFSDGQILVNYSIEKSGGIRFLDEEMPNVDTVSLKNKLNSIIERQAALRIIGYKSDGNVFYVYLDPTHIKSLPVKMKSKEYRGVLVFTSENPNNLNIIKSTDNSELASVEEGVYFYTFNTVTGYPDYEN